MNMCNFVPGKKSHWQKLGIVPQANDLDSQNYHYNYSQLRLYYLSLELTKTQTAKITTIQTFAQHMIIRFKTNTPKILLDLLLNMQPL